MSDSPHTTLADALAAAQGEIRNPALDGVNPHFRSRFATLASCLKAVRPVFAKHGLAIVQAPSSHDGGVALTTTIMHSTGTVESTVACRCGSKVQEMGSAISYLRRYALCSMVGIVGDDDDDGNQAVAGFSSVLSEARAMLADRFGPGSAASADEANRWIQEQSEGRYSLDNLDSEPGQILRLLKESP